MMSEDVSVSGLTEKLQKIGEGRYREVYAEGKHAIKVLKPSIRKGYGWFSLSFPTKLYSNIIFGNSDLNALEYKNFKNYIEYFDPYIKDRFMHIFGFSETETGSVCRCELIKNSDGSISKQLKKYNHVGNGHFWHLMTEVEEALVKYEMPYFNISDTNVLVRQDGNDCVPVFCDHKRVGIIANKFQPNAWTDSGAERKIRREFARLRKRYSIY